MRKQFWSVRNSTWMDQSCFAVPLLSRMYCIGSTSSTSPVTPGEAQLSSKSTGLFSTRWVSKLPKPPSGFHRNLAASPLWIDKYGSCSSRSGCISHTKRSLPRGMVRACILMTFAPWMVPASWPVSFSTEIRAPERSRPSGFPTPSPVMIFSVSSRSAARVKPLPTKPVRKAASCSISSVQ